jgi:hypothetical protein
MNPEMEPWNRIAAATDDPQTQGPWPDNMRDVWREQLQADRYWITGGGIWDTAMFPLQRRNELEAMAMLAARATQGRHGVVMEIGADKGGTLLHWLVLTGAKTIIANEVRGCPYSDLFAAKFIDREFLWHEQSSYTPEGVAAVARFLNGRTIDFLFIDGNKAEFRRDFDCYRHFMRPGGIVCMHDIQDDAPGRAFRSLQSDYITGVIVDTTQSAAAMVRERSGIPAATPHEEWLRFWKGRSCGVGVIYIPQ